MTLVPSTVHKNHSRERKRATSFLQFTPLPTKSLENMLQTLTIFAREDQDCVARIILWDVRIGVDLDRGGGNDGCVNRGALPVHFGVMLHHLHPEQMIRVSDAILGASRSTTDL